MKIYTKTGDAGETGLFGGPRVRKDDVRIEAYGTVDELNAALGLARCEPLAAAIDACLLRVQSELFSVGAELATPKPETLGTALVGEVHITALEQAIAPFRTSEYDWQQISAGLEEVFIHLMDHASQRKTTTNDTNNTNKRG